MTATKHTNEHNKFVDEFDKLAHNQRFITKGCGYQVPVDSSSWKESTDLVIKHYYIGVP